MDFGRVSFRNQSSISYCGTAFAQALHSPAYCTPILENAVAEAQLTRVHDAICFFVAFFLTDFVSCGFASIFFSQATSPKNAASDFFPLGMFHRNLIAS
jgi:hypothetical protein